VRGLLLSCEAARLILRSKSAKRQVVSTVFVEQKRGLRKEEVARFGAWVAGVEWKFTGGGGGVGERKQIESLLQGPWPTLKF
jgi:hypothetical protein